MPEFVAVNDSVTCFLDSLKLSNILTQKGLGISKFMQDVTVFPNQYRRFKPTVADTAFSASGLADFVDDGPDEFLYARLSTQGHILSIGVDGSSVGDVGYTYKATQNNYTPIVAPSAEDVMRFTISAVTDQPPLVRGFILEDSRTVRNATFNGTVVDFGTPPAGKKIYASLHVIAGTGGTLTVSLESDDNVGMGTPATVFSFTGATGFTAEMKNSSTDLQRYYRIAANISGGTTWQFFVIAGYGT